MQDSAGVTVVTNAGTTSVPIVPALTGAAERLAGPEVRSVQAIRILADGRIAVASRGTSQIVTFERAGGGVGVGRRGDGPGEFDGIQGMFLCAADSLVIFSFKARLSWFDPAGGFVRLAQLVPKRPPMSWEVAGVTADCSTAAVVTVERPSVQPQRVFAYRLTLGWYDLAGDSIRSVLSVPGWEMAPWEAELPFGNFPVWAVHGDEMFVGTSDRAEVRIFDRQGALRRVVRWDAVPESRPANAAARYQDAREALVKIYGKDYLAGFRGFNEYPVPPRRPVFSRLVVDGEGRLWVQKYPDQWPAFERILKRRFDSDAAEWWVFEKSGRLAGRFTTPPGMMFHDARHGIAVGMTRDSFDVESVEVSPMHLLRDPQGR